MASTNFKRFNEALNNILSDLEYLNNSTRYNGAQSGIYPASLHNKFAYQASAMCSGLADMMVAKGYTVEDGSLGTAGHDYAALVSVLGNLITQYDLDALELVYPDPSLPDQTIVTADRSVSKLEAEKLGEPFGMTFPRGTYTFREDYTGLVTTIMILQPGAIIQPWYSVRETAYAWVNTSGSEYRCDLAGGGDPEIATPLTVYANGVALAEGSVGSLSAGQYAYASGRLVVRLSDSTDPDTKAAGYVTVGYAVTFNNCLMPYLTQTIDLSGGGIVLPRNCGSFVPEWWGAKPDGTTDCATAFADAIAAMPADDPSELAVGKINGGVLQLQAGKYVLASPIVVTIPGVKIIGAGSDSTCIEATSSVGANPVITLASEFNSTSYPGWKKQIGFHLADFAITTNNNGTSGILVKQSYLYRGVIERLNVCGYGGNANTAYGITDDGETPPAFSNGLFIRNCDILGFKYGIKVTGSVGGTYILHNFLEGSKALSGSTAIYIEGSNVNVLHNYMQNWDYGIQNLPDGFWSVFAHNIFETGSFATYAYYEDNSGPQERQAYLLWNAWVDLDKVSHGLATNRQDHGGQNLTGVYPNSARTDLRGQHSHLAIYNPNNTDYTYYPPYTAEDFWLVGLTQYYGMASPAVLNSWGDTVPTSTYWAEISSHAQRLDVGTVDHSGFPVVVHAGPYEVARGVNGRWHIGQGISGAPANAGDSGQAGALSYDSGYLYVCVATDTWKRVALSTW